MLFKRREVNPYSVTDKAVFRNVDKTLALYVRADASALVIGLKKAQDYLATLNDESDEDEKRTGARRMASAIFGDEQAQKLLDFYPDPLTVITACGIYIGTLAPKIVKAQKR